MEFRESLKNTNRNVQKPKKISYICLWFTTFQILRRLDVPELEKSDLRLLLRVQEWCLWDIAEMLVGTEYGGINKLDIWGTVHFVDLDELFWASWLWKDIKMAKGTVNYNIPAP